jgi:hypothetical protein
MDQAGSQKSGWIRSWGRVGSDSRSSWERGGSLVPCFRGATGPGGAEAPLTCRQRLGSPGRVECSRCRRKHPGRFRLRSPASGPKRSRIGPSGSLPSGRCPSSKRFPKPTIPDQDSHKIPLSARSATSDYAYARRVAFLVDTNFGNLDRQSGATVAEAGHRRRERSWGDTSQCNLFWGVSIMQRSRIPIQINQKDPWPAWCAK